MPQNKIGFDIDGVLYNWHEPLFRELQMYHGLTVPWNVFWKDVHKYYSHEFIANILKIESLYSCMKPTSTTLDVLNILAEKYEIYYITNRPVDVKIATENWFKREKLPYPENIILTQDKPSKISELKLIAFTEDRVENIKEIKGCMKFLMDQTWNEDWEEEDCTRIYSLKELLKWI